MKIKKLKPEYVPVQVELTKEEADAVKIVLGIIEDFTMNDIVLFNAYYDEEIDAMQTTADFLEELRSGFDGDVELRIYQS